MSRTISFDLDGTLLHGPFGAVLREVLPSLGGGTGSYPEILRRHEGFLRRHPYDAYDWIAIIASVTRADPEEVWRVLEHGQRDQPVRMVHDGTVGILAGLSESGWRVVVLTNGRRRYQEPVLRAARLPIDELVTSDDVGEVKPAAAMFAAARGESGRYVHVGDRIDHDVAGARDAGATSILLRSDAPITSWTRDLDAAGLDEVERYVLRVAVDEGTAEPDSPVRPDGIANSLAGVQDLLG